MPSTFFFYDLETSGFNPRTDRIMQFAGQRTDMNLKIVGDPINVLIRLGDDIIPSPEAILVTGITPQKTRLEGLSEAEFIKLFNEEISVPNTIFVGFNSIRFDDEFMRFINWRNYNDAYEWQWKDGRSRWDLLDVVRLTRALRPNGIKWPVDSKGNSANRLELLASINKLKHESAHDALSDVYATIELAKLIKQKQPKLFEYMLDLRDKNKIAALVGSGEPFVYSSGKYDAQFEKTTVALKLANHPKKNGALVWDLRYNPEEFAELSAEQIVQKWQYNPEQPDIKFPLKTLLYNRCPAIAPINVLDKDSQKRLKIELSKIKQNQKNLNKNRNKLTDAINKALEILDKKQQKQLLSDERTAETQLYDSFVADNDKKLANEITKMSSEEIANYSPNFKDARLNNLFLPYKARNYPKTLSENEQKKWEENKLNKLLNSENSLKKYFDKINDLSEIYSRDQQKLYLLEELKLYGESLMP